MTTRKFSSTQLPYPKYTLEFDSIKPVANNSALTPWISGFFQVAQLVEVRKNGLANHASLAKCASALMRDYIVIESARPELFLRRDFIQQFVKHGTVHISCDGNNAYHLSTSGSNILTILLSEKKYRRFGLVAKKVISQKNLNTKLYRIDIDLNDDKIIRSNKYQDKLVQTLKRLEPIWRVYFRFEPKVGFDSSRIAEKSENPTAKCYEYFRYVIEEYARDGFKPVPLSDCSVTSQKVCRKWTNFAQHHAKFLDENFLLSKDEGTLSKITTLLDWLGSQVLSLDCAKNGESKIRTSNEVTGDGGLKQKQELVDVSGIEIRGGLIDSCQANAGLLKLLEYQQSSSVEQPIVSAILLYGLEDPPLGLRENLENDSWFSSKMDTNSNTHDCLVDKNSKLVVLLQDYSCSSSSSSSSSSSTALSSLILKIGRA